MHLVGKECQELLVTKARVRQEGTEGSIIMVRGKVKLGYEFAVELEITDKRANNQVA